MKKRYDPTADALYISLRKGVVSRTIRSENGICIDVDAFGAILGIEILHLRHYTERVSPRTEGGASAPVPVLAV